MNQICELQIVLITCSYASDELGSGYWEDVAHNLEYQSFEDPLEYQDAQENLEYQDAQENLEYQNIGENNFFSYTAGKCTTVRGMSSPTFIAVLMVECRRAGDLNMKP